MNAPITIDPRRNAVADAIASRQGYIGGAANAAQYADADAALAAADANDPARALLREFANLSERFLLSTPDTMSPRDFLTHLRGLEVQAAGILGDEGAFQAVEGKYEVNLTVEVEATRPEHADEVKDDLIDHAVSFGHVSAVTIEPLRRRA